jgi:hypothetical protein
MIISISRGFFEASSDKLVNPASTKLKQGSVSR